MPPKRKLHDDREAAAKKLNPRGNVTSRDLQEILNLIKSKPEVLEYGKRDLERNFHERFDAVRTVIKIDYANGSGSYDWTIADPSLLLGKVRGQIKQDPET